MTSYFRMLTVISLLSAGVFPLLSACTTPMMETETAVSTISGNYRCETSAAAYRLPKAVLKISIVKAGNRGFQVTALENSKMIADPNLEFCLDHVTSLLSDDQIAIKRTREGILQQITTEAVDKSKDVIERAIDIGRTAALLRSGGNAASSDETAELYFDPADASEIAARNRGLRRFGICIYVEGVNFDPNTQSPESWCDNPARQTAASGPVGWVISAPIDRREAGVYYRPNMAHRVVVMRKLDPFGPNKWIIHFARAVEMPNLSPIYSVRVDRTFFATHETRIDFQNGMLADVRIKKTSQAEQLSSIPLKLAQAFVALPAELVQFRTADLQGQAMVLNAEILRNQEALAYAKTIAGIPQAAQTASLPAAEADVVRSGRVRPAAASVTQGAIPMPYRSGGPAADPQQLARDRNFQSGFLSNCRDADIDHAGCQTVWRQYFAR